MRLRLIWALALVASAIAPALAAPVPAPVKVDQVDKAAGLRLARSLFSEQSQVDIAMRMVDNDLAPMFRRNEDFKILEAEHPGFIDAVLAEFKVALARQTRASLPSYYERSATVVALHLRAPEIEELEAFYKTPTGQKLLRGIAANVTTNAVLTEVEADPDKPTTSAALAADREAMTNAVKGLLDETDTPALITLGKKPYLARAKAMTAALHKLQLEFMNEPMPEFEKEVERIIDNTLAKFEARKNEK